MLLGAASLIAKAPLMGAADAILAYDGTAKVIRAAAINFVVAFDMGTPTVNQRQSIVLRLCFFRVLLPSLDQLSNGRSGLWSTPRPNGVALLQLHSRPGASLCFTLKFVG